MALLGYDPIPTFCSNHCQTPCMQREAAVSMVRRAGVCQRSNPWAADGWMAALTPDLFSLRLSILFLNVWAATAVQRAESARIWPVRDPSASARPLSTRWRRCRASCRPLRRACTRSLHDPVRWFATPFPLHGGAHPACCPRRHPSKSHLDDRCPSRPRRVDERGCRPHTSCVLSGMVVLQSEVGWRCANAHAERLHLLPAELRTHRSSSLGSLPSPLLWSFFRSRWCSYMAIGSAVPLVSILKLSIGQFYLAR